MSAFKSGLALLLCLMVQLPAMAESYSSLLGFSEAAAARQSALESQFDALIDPSQISAWSRELARHPHHPGSIHAKRNAEYIADKFRAWGFAADIVTYEILLPTPLTRELEMLAPRQFVASLSEDPVAGDASTQQHGQLLPPYNAFSTDGEVEAELVFVNYGVPEDYETLARYGVDVQGKIVIARYGKSWRGIKPKLAAEHGAVGTLIYSDPADDGYAQGDVYPKGPFKNASGVQRGSVMDMPLYPGDVQTPGRAASRNARRIPLDKVEVITKVPVLPISYRDAQPLLAALDGAVVPPEWRGALPITYHFGPGPARVRLKLAFDWRRIEIYNVIARLRGSRYPQQWVVRGNHHDAWNHGAADPVSGMTALLAEARAVGEMAQAGEPPLRTIVYAAWDAEEPGLIGSTEWVEDNARVLAERAVAYINTDGNSRGFLLTGGSHTLEPFFNQVAAAVKDPQTGVSLQARRAARVRVAGTEEQRMELKERGALRLIPLGSGSDYTPFLQHLGIAAANLTFRGEGQSGSYHTLYDTFEHYATFRDPGFVYGGALAQTAGRAVLRLANAEVLPFRFAALVDNLQHYLEQIEKLAETKRKEALEINQNLADGVYALALDPQKQLGPPLAKSEVPHFNLAPLKNVLDELQAASQQLDQALEELSAAPGEELGRINQLLYQSERQLTSADGLPGRPWYRHQVYAPGFYTGYGVKTLPRVREAIEAGLYDSVDDNIAHTADVLAHFAAYLKDIKQEIQAL